MRKARIIYTIHHTPRGRRYSARMGDVLPCCDPSIGTFSALFSNTCNLCSSADYQAQQQLMQNPNNAGNTSGVPCCDPNTGFFSALFSNTCNLCNPIGAAVGLPQIPSWVWVTGAVATGLFVLRGAR